MKKFSWKNIFLHYFSKLNKCTKPPKASACWFYFPCITQALVIDRVYKIDFFCKQKSIREMGLIQVEHGYYSFCWPKESNEDKPVRQTIQVNFK